MSSVLHEKLEVSKKVEQVAEGSEENEELTKEAGNGNDQREKEHTEKIERSLL